MKDFDIPGYLDGKLSGKELEDFNQKLESNAAFREEVEGFRQIAKDLKRGFLREQLAAALQSGNDSPPDDFQGKKAVFDRRFLWLLLFLPVLGLLLFYVKSNSSESEVPKTEPIEEPEFEESKPAKKKIKPTLPDPIQPVEPEKEKPKVERKSSPKVEPTPKSKPPIFAENKPTKPSPNDDFEPRFRGENLSDEERDDLIDSIWWSAFPPEGVEFGKPFEQVSELLKNKEFQMAYIRLKSLERKLPQSDTLLFLKGYCLTELREGTAAIKEFEQLEAVPEAWKNTVEWYSGLNYFLIGENEKSIEIFRKISGKEEHSFKKQSKRALEFLN